MMDWLEQQRTRLHGFYRTEYRYSLRITAIAFGALILLGFAVSLLLPDLADQLFLQFAQQMAELGIMDTTGRVDVLALFGNNVRATVFSIAYGFIPFIYLPALSIGINSLLLGLFAGVYVNNGISLLAYFAGIVPHGIFELPALILALSSGIYLCRKVTDYVRHNEKGVYGSPDEGSAAPVRHAHHPPAGGSGGDRGLCDTAAFEAVSVKTLVPQRAAKGASHEREECTKHPGAFWQHGIQPGSDATASAGTGL